MKLGYYHYFFKARHKRNAPRICHDLRPMFDAYINYSDIAWKTEIESDDGEKLLLLETPLKQVYMLVATRHQEIIKAIHTRTLNCADLSERLREDEAAGFAAYLRFNEKVLGMASTLRGPKTAALERFVNGITKRLGAEGWEMNLLALGSSVSLQQAKGMAFIARTSLKVGPTNPFFLKLKELFASDSDDVDSFEITVRGRRNRNLREVFEQIAQEVSGDDLDKLRIRARAALDQDLSDYFVDADGRFSEDIGTGTESEIIRSVSLRFNQQKNLDECLNKIMEDAHYEERKVQALDNLGNLAFWNTHLQPEQADVV